MLNNILREMSPIQASPKRGALKLILPHPKIDFTPLINRFYPTRFFRHIHTSIKKHLKQTDLQRLTLRIHSFYRHCFCRFILFVPNVKKMITQDCLNVKDIRSIQMQFYSLQIAILSQNITIEPNKHYHSCIHRQFF